MCVLNTDISIKGGCKIHSRNLFLSSLGDLPFKVASLPSYSPAFITNEIWGGPMEDCSKAEHGIDETVESVKNYYLNSAEYFVKNHATYLL